MNSKKIVNICLIIAGFFLYYVAAQIFELVFDGFKIPISREYWLTMPEIFAVLLAILAFVLVMKSKLCVGFLVEAVTELLKVVYPTKMESGQSAVVVIVMVSFATVFLVLFDSLWSYCTQAILSN